MEGDGSDQVSPTYKASQFDGTSNYNPSRIRFYVPGLGNVQVLEYNKFFKGAEMSMEMPPVSFENWFILHYVMDADHSYLAAPLDAQGLITNTITPVDREFFDSVSWSNLKAEAMAASLRVLSPFLS